MKKQNMCFSVWCVLGRFTVLIHPYVWHSNTSCVCVTVCYQNPEIIGIELPKLLDAEEADGAVDVASFPSLLPYNSWTTADYSGLTNNLLSFQLVPTNPDGTP